MKSRQRKTGSGGKLLEIFHHVRDFVSQKFLSLKAIELEVGCPVIEESRMAGGLDGSRAYMHVAHHGWTICCAKVSKDLPIEHLVGILLHEFGHLGSHAGEEAADQWVRENFGIWIQYKGGLALEWVPATVVRKILS